MILIVSYTYIVMFFKFKLSSRFKICGRENCGDKMEAFLSRTYYLNGGYDNRHGMSKLNARMEQIEVKLKNKPHTWVLVRMKGASDV